MRGAGKCHFCAHSLTASPERGAELPAEGARSEFGDVPWLVAESSPWEQGARAGALQEQREGQGAQVTAAAPLGQLGGAVWAAQSAATARGDGWTGQTDRRSRAPGTEPESAYSSRLPEGSGVHALAAG